MTKIHKITLLLTKTFKTQFLITFNTQIVINTINAARNVHRSFLIIRNHLAAWHAAVLAKVFPVTSLMDVIRDEVGGLQTDHSSV